jgi:hypothetical protein
VIGAGQALASRRFLDPRTWVPASAVGMGLGLLVGAASVDYGTSLDDLVVMGALTGLFLGVAVLWALGWTVSTLAAVDVETQYTIFGATGALTFSALSGALLYQLLRQRSAADQGLALPMGKTIG